LPAYSGLDLRLLAYFQAAVEAGNITRAAERLNLAQPTLSKALRLLEAQLGVELLVRGAYGVSPTPIGERLMAHARRVGVQVADAVAEVEALRIGAAGRVRVGAGPSWVRRLLPDAVASLLDDFPEIDVSVTTGFDMGLLEGLLEGTLDFVVAERPLSGEDAAFAYRSLTRDDLVVCARAGHPLAGRRVPVAAALAARWALPGELSLARRKLAGRMTLLGVAQPGRVVTSSSIGFLLGLALKTDALVYTTRSMLSTPEAAGLVELDLPEFVTEREAGLVTRAGAIMSPTAAMLAERLAALCAGDTHN
jgi:LysR family transcriptional regulator of gallate degradation